MTTTKTHITALLFFIVTVSCFAQLESRSGHIGGFSIDKWYEISVDPAILQTLINLKQPKNQPFQFAYPVPVTLTPANSGFIKKSGSELIWTIGIHSASAKSLNVILSPFNIPEGAYVYVYDQSITTIRGAFGSENNNPSETLPVMPVPGDRLILEYHLPLKEDWHGTIGISQVAHDFLGIFSNLAKDDRFGTSQPCEVDIACPAGTDYYDQKRAVCRIIIRGIELCSGSLINNTSQENKALLVTAQHCITSSSDAASSIFVFGYESPWCQGPDGNVYHSISGSSLRASNENIDFSLVELSSFPPFTYHPYLAGWDVSGAIPNKAAAIHHPMGDVKKISVDLNQPVTGTYSGYTTNGFWKILQWDLGTTEGGSSGSPLFDQNKRIVGLLTGGEAQCGLSINDYFAKLSYSYDLSSNLTMQLKGWIDPAVSGVLRLDGRDPYAPNLLTVDTLSNLSASETRIITPFGSGSGYSTGYNSDSLTAYAEYFVNPSAKQVSGILIDMAKVVQLLPADSASLYIMADGSVPGAVLAQQAIYFSEAKDTFVTRIDFKTTVPVGGNFFVAWKIYYHSPAATESRQFAVFHSPDRTNPALNTAWFKDNVSWKPFTDHPFAPMSVSLDVKAVVIGNPVVNAVNDIKPVVQEFSIYPNPAGDKVWISSPDVVNDVLITIYDFKGSAVLKKRTGNSFPGKYMTDISTLGKGLYYLVIQSEKGRETHKLIIGL